MVQLLPATVARSSPTPYMHTRIVSCKSSIPILNNSSHKPTSREIHFGKIVITFVIA